MKADGTVVATGRNTYGQCDVSGWKDIIAISAGYYHTVGLKKDGTVVATGCNTFGIISGQCDVSGWKDIIAISAGDHHTVGLKADGTVVATGDNEDGQCDVSGWKDIIAVSAGLGHTVDRWQLDIIRLVNVMYRAGKISLLFRQDGMIQSA